MRDRRAGESSGRDASGAGNRGPAEEIGLAALLFLTEDADRLGRFLGETGLSPGELKRTAGSAEGLVAVLDYLLADESLLMVFAAGAGLEPAEIGPARDLLGGGSDAREFASTNFTSGHTGGRTARAPRKASKRWAGPDA